MTQFRTPAKGSGCYVAVTISSFTGTFVIPCGTGCTTLGFDVCFDRTRRIARELGDKSLEPTEALRGTLPGYAEYERACAAAEALYERTGRRLTCDLTPELIGLEGRMVEVVDRHGELRAFKVGKSVGLIPVHLELARNAIGGEPVSGAPFRSVRVMR